MRSLIAFVLLALWANDATARPLFEATALRPISTAAANSRVVRSTHALTFDSQPEKLLENESIEFVLPKEGKVTAKIKSRRQESQRIHMTLSIDEDPLGNAVLIFDKKSRRLSGNLFVGGNTYFLHHEGHQTQLVESNPTQYEGPNPQLPYVSELMEQNEVSPQATVTSTSSDNFVDVMLLYTDDVAAYSDVESTLRARVDSANNVLEQSCANFRFRLVHIAEVNYAETANSSTDLAQLADDSDGVIDAIHTLRDTYGADLVQLVTNTSSLCGLAYVAQEDFYNDDYGFSVTGYWCNYRTMTHEWGHNLGATHDRYQQNVDFEEETLLLTGYGYVDLLNKYLDIMAYPNHCDAVGMTCTTVDQFSNPAILHHGVAFGHSGFSDSVLRMNQAQPYISNFRDAQSSYSPDIKPYCVATSENKDIHCFIATAAFGTYLAPQVLYLRNFRDSVLKQTRLGRWLVRIYYDHSPFMAAYIEHSKSLAAVARVSIWILVFVLKHWLLLSAIVLLLALLGITRHRRSVLFPLILFALVHVPQATEAAVTFPSKFYTEVATNPALPLLSKAAPWFAVSYGLANKDRSGSSAIEETHGSSRISLQVGQLATEYYFELGLTPEYESETEVSRTGYATVSDTFQEQAQYGQAGLMVWGFPLGFRIEQSQSTHKESGDRTNQQSLTSGVTGKFGENVRWGLGAKVVEEWGHQIARSRWLEPFLGLSAGLFTSENPFYLELSARRSPEVLSRDGDNINAHGETLTLDVAIEYASKTGFWIFQPFLFRLGYETASEKALEVYVLEDYETNTVSLDIGSSLFSPTLYWTLGYAMTTSGYEYEESGSKIRLSIHWSGAEIL